MSSIKEKKIPLRMCVACREMKPKSELLRVVKSPGGNIAVDVTFKAPGRGAYICKNSGCFKKAVKTKALSRVFKTAIPDEIINTLQTETL